METVWYILLLTVVISSIVCPPVKPGAKTDDKKEDHPSTADEVISVILKPIYVD